MSGLEILKNKYPILSNSFFSEINSPHLQYLFDYLENFIALSNSDLEKVIDSYAQTSFEFLKLQEKFLRTGKYAAISQSNLVTDLYSKPASMENYLLGLLATYIFWENHFKMFEFFCDKFVERNQATINESVMEIGTGHGLFASYMMDRKESISYYGIDISRSSLNFAEQMFTAKFPKREITLLEMDATALDFYVPKKFDFAICCEVLEHVEEPALILQNILNNLSKTGKAFITTVCNLEAIDHIYLFNNPQEIRTMIINAGFQIDDEEILNLPNEIKTQIKQINYAAIISPSST
jgi:2-polyprenyl-3-methyl-5-hydroxy-6-metoxy-1,4-benzoquinol methylase